jgi:hypothetical protein
MTNLYLIIHKVRGEPAFDIAEKVMIGNEEGWIIPTSGHRAYPINATPLAEPITPVNEADWDSLPDHYSAKRDDSPTIEHFRALLGLNKPKPINTYRRR